MWHALLKAIATAALLADASAVAHAQGFPTRPVVLIVPWPAGGTTDVAIRALTTATERRLGQSIVIENRAGAGGTLAPIQMASTAAPDGYVVSQIPISVLRAPLTRRTTFDPVNDLTYIIGLTGYTFGVAVRGDAPWKTFGELLAYAKRNPGKLTYGTSGAGTTPHLTMFQIAQREGIDWVHVPFKGSAESMNALFGGHVDAVAEATSWTELIDAGRLRLLVTWGAQRPASLPNVPTLRESGIDIVTNAPYGIAGPKGVAPAVVAKLHDAFRNGMDDPSYGAVLRQLDQEPYYLNSQDYADFAKREVGEQGQLLKQLGINPD